MAKVPQWAAAALATFAPVPAFGETDPNPEAAARHHAYTERISSRWAELEADFVPCVRALSDLGKQTILEQALWCGKFFDQDTGRQMREDARELKRLNSKICRLAEKLAELLRQRDLLLEEGGASDDMPDLYDLIEAAGSKHLTWEQMPEVDDFLRAARETSIPGVELVDLVGALAEGNRNAWVKRSAFSVRTASRADLVRLLLDAVEKVGVPIIPKEFQLSDRAIGARVSVVFDLPEIDPRAITTNRFRAR